MNTPTSLTHSPQRFEDTIHALGRSLLWDDDVCPTLPRRPPFHFPPRRRGWPWPDPPSPWTQRLVSLLEKSAPDGFHAAAVIAGALMEFAAEMTRSLSFLDAETQKTASANLAQTLTGIVGDCGSVPIRVLIERLLRAGKIKLPRPPRDPDWPEYLKAGFTEIEQITFHAVVIAAGELVEGGAIEAVVKQSRQFAGL